MIKLIAEKTQKLSKLAFDYVEGMSYSTLRKLLRKKDIKVNGKRVSDDLVVNAGALVEIYYQPNQNPFDIVYQDENVLVVNKFSGFTSENLFECLKKIYVSIKFIHRLDRNTSGLMIFALNNKAEEELLIGFKNRLFTKLYHATVKGFLTEKCAIKKAYLLKDAEKSFVKVFDNPVKYSVQILTEYKVLSENKENNTSLVEVNLLTGKTHQIRAHFAHMGYPLLGDDKYGDAQFNKQNGAKSQALKAVKLILNFSKEQSLYYLNGKQFILED